MPLRDPGTALVAEIAAHWSVTPPTARRILRDAGLSPANEEGWERYSWVDVWRIEGEAYVPPHLWSAFRAPLLTPPRMAVADPRGRSARTMRRLRARGRLPEIRLAKHIRRMRAEVLEAVGSYA